MATARVATTIDKNGSRHSIVVATLAVAMSSSSTILANSINHFEICVWFGIVRS